jgi:FixJ family two-component response regulator
MNSDSPIVFEVDDDYRVREALSSLISSVGIRVAVFGSAAEFVESEKPDAPATNVDELNSQRCTWYANRWSARSVILQPLK